MQIPVNMSAQVPHDPAIHPSLPVKDGSVPFQVGHETFETWYRLCGQLEGASEPPLIVLHGGPGLIHDYVLPISDLAKAGDRAVIFYDQLGNGRSTHLRDKPAEFWTVDLFIDELINLTHKLGIASRFDLCGHSWGGMLGMEYLIRRQPTNLRRFICSNSPASIPGYMQDLAALLSKFPKWVQECWDKKDTDYECFRAANDAFDAIHTINIVPFPKEHVDSLDSIYGPDADPTVVDTMYKAKLKNWTAVGRLHAINVPVLLINGRDDKVTDATAQPIFFEVPKVRWVTMDKSSHMPFWEERERYMQLVDAWLRMPDA